MAKTALLRLLLVLAFLMPDMAALAGEISRADQSAFQQIINDQIAAFNAHDGLRAYSHAAPVIKQLFPSPDIFMSMVKKGYEPVYRQKSFSFGQVLDDMGRPAQKVRRRRRWATHRLDSPSIPSSGRPMGAAKSPVADWCGYRGGM